MKKRAPRKSRLPHGADNATQLTVDPAKKMEKIRVGFIGAGQISELHARGYLNNPTGELVAVADTDPAVADQRSTQYGAGRWFTDYREMLEGDHVDAVEILLPHHLHLPVTLDALSAGKHVSLQKPMALNMDEARQLSRAAASSNRLFRVFENFRSYEPYRVARDMIEQGDIGETLSIRVKVVSGRGVGGWVQPESAIKWRRNVDTGGGPPAIIDHGYHITSIVPFFMGPVERVHAMGDITHAGSDRYMGVPSMVTWKHEGAEKYGSWETVNAPEMMIRTAYYPGDEVVEITGTRGIVWVTRCSANLLDEAPVILYRDGKTTRLRDMKTDWGESFVAGAHDFTAAIVNGTQPDLSAADASHALAFSLAAMKSMLDHTEVRLDEL